MNPISITPAFLRGRLLHREDDSHKGDYGHLLVVAGCETMPGAAVLATGAALHAGCGLVTLHSTARALQAVVDRYPSAMLSEEPRECFSELRKDISKYSAIAAGPGLGQSDLTLHALAGLLAEARAAGIPMVLDADALNLMAAHPELLDRLPAGSILTPHKGEFRRLVGEIPVEQEEEKASALARHTDSTVVLKGFHTRVFNPDGSVLVNTTGNPGLAKGGSGDVLTGLVGGLLARGYPARDAAALGVWLHGHAGDVLTTSRTAEAFSSADLIDPLSCGFHFLYREG